jgi:hypothetical protein
MRKVKGEKAPTNRFKRRRLVESTPKDAVREVVADKHSVPQDFEVKEAAEPQGEVPSDTIQPLELKPIEQLKPDVQVPDVKPEDTERKIEDEEFISIEQLSEIPAVKSGADLAERSASSIKDIKAENAENSQPPGTPDISGNYYYLIKPRTTIQQRVLIPLSPSAPLSCSIQGQTVLEFPSIQVLSVPPTALPANFVLEEEYLRAANKQEEEMKKLLEEDNTPQTGMKSETNDVEQVSGAKNVPNSADIFAILQRDILG